MAYRLEKMATDSGKLKQHHRSEGSFEAKLFQHWKRVIKKMNILAGLGRRREMLREDYRV